jgi:hypothetical protein
MLPFKIFPNIAWFVEMEKTKPAKVGYISSKFKEFTGNKILLPGPNSLQFFSIPLSKKSISSNLSQIETVEEHKWKREFKNALQTIYGKSPFYEYYDYKLWEALDSIQGNTLGELFLTTLKWSKQALQNDSEIELVACESVGLDCEITINPYRQMFQEKVGFVKDAPIFDLIFNCGPEASVYLNNLILNNNKRKDT